MHQLTILLTHTASETHSCTPHSLNSQTPRLLTVKDSATSILRELLGFFLFLSGHPWIGGHSFDMGVHRRIQLLQF
jgi:hypothetical protein